MSLDIHSAVQTAFILALIGTLLSAWLGIRAVRSGLRLPYFRKRNDRMWRGYRLIFAAVILVALAFSLNRFAEPVAYRFFPPSPTVTLTPTITQTPTITLTPTISLAPTITDTPSITNTPAVPADVASKFESTTTPNPDVVFSPLSFARKIDEAWQPVDPAVEFENPVGHLYATFSYDGMVIGAQWTALWYRGVELVHVESNPWDGSTGGYGYSDWQPESANWMPGLYEVQIFVGLDWKISGQFTVTGEVPTAANSATASRTTRPTSTPTVSRTPRPTAIPTATLTPRPTLTATLTRTPTLSPTITLTRTPTRTLRPSATITPTFTRHPTLTNPPRP